MTRGLIIVKAANVERLGTLAQQPPFEVLPETQRRRFYCPANPVYAEDGMTITTPATLYWASGVFEGRVLGGCGAKQ